jgi:CrcB protein
VTTRVYAAVFIGGCLGGSARLGIDHSLDLGAWSWDIVAINIGGSALLGALMGWFSTHRTPWWVPGVGAGVLGGFTTFSAAAAPHEGSPLPGAVLLIGTLVGASIAAAVSWGVAEKVALRKGGSARSDDPEEIEAEIEGFERDEKATA